jgi:hypothetical protein
MRFRPEGRHSVRNPIDEHALPVQRQRVVRQEMSVGDADEFTVRESVGVGKALHARLQAAASVGASLKMLIRRVTVVR